MKLKAKRVTFTLENDTEVSVDHKLFDRWRADTVRVFESTNMDDGCYLKVTIWAYLDASSPLYSLYARRNETYSEQHYFTTEAAARAHATRFLKTNT